MRTPAPRSRIWTERPGLRVVGVTDGLLPFVLPVADPAALAAREDALAGLPDGARDEAARIAELVDLAWHVEVT